MFAPIPPDAERLEVQPIVIPRAYDHSRRKLRFCVVFSFVRRNDGGYHAKSQRQQDRVELRDCLLGTGSVYWPNYIASLFNQGQVSAVLQDGANSYTAKVKLQSFRDLDHAGWTQSAAEKLWKNLIQPAAQETDEAFQAGAGPLPSQGVSQRVGSISAGEADDVNPQAFLKASTNAWTASDLRPGLRLENINTRSVARNINQFVTHTLDDPPSDEKEFVDYVQKEVPSEVIDFIRERDQQGELIALLLAVKENDQVFIHNILPDLMKDESFPLQMLLLKSLYQDYWLILSRGEFQRQTRFVDSARHREPVTPKQSGRGDLIRTASLHANPPPDPLAFEKRVSRLRQHPGLMRRLYLTLPCEIDVGELNGIGDKIDLGRISLVIQAGPSSPFVLLATPTAFDLFRNGARGYFRASADPTQRVQFYGLPDHQKVAEDQFRRGHLLATDLYQVTQDDPTLAMLRASQDVTDAFQDEAEQARVEGIKPEVRRAIDPLPHRVNAVNIYRREYDPKNPKEELPIVVALQAAVRRNEELFAGYNAQVQSFVDAVRERPNPIRPTNYRKLVAAANAEMPAVFYADNLMMGCSIHVQAMSEGSPVGPWRHLNRRRGSLKILGKHECDFEEEGCIALSIVRPPRPLTGRVAEFTPFHSSPDTNGKVQFHLLSNDNAEGATPESFEITKDTRAPISPLSEFHRKAGDYQPQPHDLVLAALVGVPPGSRQGQHPREVEELFVHPVLKATSNELKNAVTKNGFQMFSSSVLLTCLNAVPTTGGEHKPRGDDWKAKIVIAPHFTRLVDYRGRAILPLDLNKPEQLTEFKTLEYFTVESVMRQFGQRLAELQTVAKPISQWPPNDAPQLTMTNVGPLNQLPPAQLNEVPIQLWQLPDPRRSLAAPGGKPIDPIPQITPGDVANHAVRVGYAPDARWQVIRGRVRRIGFVFVLNAAIGLGPAKPHHVLKFRRYKIDGSVKSEHWHVTDVLNPNWKFGNQDGVIPALNWDATGLPEGLTQATIVARGSVELCDKQVVLNAESLEFAAPSAELTSGSSRRWTLELERVGGGEVQLQVDVDAVNPEPLTMRFLHPLDARNHYLEAFTTDLGAGLMLRSWPQRLFGSVINDGSQLLRFPDGTALKVDADDFADFDQPTTGYFSVSAADSATPPKISLAHRQLALVAAEVSRYDEQELFIELLDAFGQVWVLPGNELDKPLPLSFTADSARTLRRLQPGEWLIAECHLQSLKGGRRALIPVLDGQGLVQARTAVVGRFALPPEQSLTRASEGTSVYRPSSVQTMQNRKLTVWTDVAPNESGRYFVAWSQRLALADTLTQYVIPSDAAARNGNPAPQNGAAIRNAAFQPGTSPTVLPLDVPHHFMVSELLTRWMNWGLGVPMPGEPDVPAAEPAAGAYEIALSRPNLSQPFPSGDPIFTKDAWLLPALRFDRRYRFCIRRVDLAGNHLYDEPLDEPLARELGTFYAELSSLIQSPGGDPQPFRRTNLPVAPLVAFTPDRLRSTLKRYDDRKPPQAVKTPDVSQDFACLPSGQRDATLVLITDVLDQKRKYQPESYLELLPPPIDVETMLLSGKLDGRPAQEVAQLIKQHERYLDHQQDKPILGRLKGDRDLNYLPDPMANRLSVTVTSAILGDSAVPPAAAVDFYADKAGQSHWPRARWVQLRLNSHPRANRRGLAAFEIPALQVSPTEKQPLHYAVIETRLPPGLVGEATLSVRPPSLDQLECEYARMIRDHGSEQRTIRLIHATNGAWTRPIWKALAETPRDPESPPTPLREIAGELTIDRLTTGACAVTAYWNDPWDESVPGQHEPAQGVVELNHDGTPVAVVILNSGFGFGSQATIIFDSAGLPFRQPTFRAHLRDGRLVKLEPVDEGTGCNVLYCVYVCPHPHACHPSAKRALGKAWHDEHKKLRVQILDPGYCLGPHVDVYVVAERPVLPEVGYKLEHGSIAKMWLSSAGQGKFSRELPFRIIRRPPFYRIAEAEVKSFTAQGGLSKIEPTERGGWYVSPPYCVAHDPSGDGYGAVLSAKLDMLGGVIDVEIVRPGRRYSPDTRIEFYNQVSEIPEQIVDDPVREQFNPPLPLSIRFLQAFPNPWARRVDYFARAASRFRQFLYSEDETPKPDENPPDIRQPVPRISPVRQLEIQGHLRPDAPEIAYLMPSFQWEIVTPRDSADPDAEAYFTERTRGSIRVRRKSLIRVYLHRPWHGSGPEQLAVVVAPAVLNTAFSSEQPTLHQHDGGIDNPAADTNAALNQPGFLNEPVSGYAIDDNLRPFVSRWGFDPAWNETAFPPLALDHFPQRRPVTIYDRLSDPGAAGGATLLRPIWLAVHDVHYDHAKDLWYSDLEVDISAGGPPVRALPFIRLGLTRYQAHGLPGRRLSAVAVSDMYKLMGQREVEVVRHDERRFTVRLLGEFDQPPENAKFPRRQVVARLEARDPELALEVVHYTPPARTAPQSTADVAVEFALGANSRRDGYAKRFEIPLEAWNTAQRFHGTPSIPVLSILEYEIFPTAESQADATGTDLLLQENRLCARRLVFSATFCLDTSEPKS